MLGLAGGSIYLWTVKGDKKSAKVSTAVKKKVESKTLKESIKWKENAEKVNEIKKSSLTAYPDVLIGEAITGDYSANVWKYGKLDTEEYWICEYTYSESNDTLVFYRDNHDNINIVEYYIDGKIQDKQAIAEATKEIFTKKTEEAQFVLANSGTYIIDDISLSAILTIKVLEKDQIQVDINLENHTYDLTYYGEIISSEMAQFTLDAGERINLVWNGINSLKVTPVNGFTDESIKMMRMLCDSLNNKSYVATTKEVTSQTESFTSAYMPANGSYFNSTDGGFPNTCEIRINQEKGNSFKFSIWEIIDGNGNSTENIIFKEHVAVFENQDDTSAVYRGKSYTVYFDCSEYGTVKLSGFSPAIKMGNIFYNIAITNQ